MKSAVRIAVIGAERRGRLARLAHRPEEGSRLVAACNLVPERIAGWKDDFGADFAIETDYRRILERRDVDAVFICTPDHLHEEHALAALDAGKYVYLEKPMAISVEACDRILARAGPAPGRLYCGHNMRFFDVMRKMRQLIAEGAVGQVQAIWCRHFVSYGGDAYFRDWHSERSRATSLLLQKGSHDLDIIHWLAGAHTRRVVGMGKLSVYDKLPRRASSEEAPSVIAFDSRRWPPEETVGYHPQMDVEDHNMLLLGLENGVQACYLQCFYAPDAHRNYTVLGTRGRIENRGDHSTPLNLASVHLWNRRVDGHLGDGHEVFRIPPAEGEHGGSDPAIVEDFLRFVRGEPTCGATPVDARMAVAAGCAGAESLRAGGMPVRIPEISGAARGGA